MLMDTGVVAPSYDVLRTFLAVYRSGSVTRGAELLGLSQPAVTAQIRGLERDLGRPLFERLPRGVRPTGAAEQLARRIAGPLDALDELVAGDVLGGAPRSFGRAVHLGGPAEMLCARVLPALAPMVAGGLQLRIALGPPDHLTAALSDGGLDMVICATRVRRSGMRAEPLCDEEFALIASARWTATDLERAPLVAYAENLPILRRYWRAVFGNRLSRVPAVVVPDLRGVLSAVVAGAGVTVLPRYLCAAELADGRLQVLVEPELPPVSTLFLVWREGPQHPAATAVRGHLLAQGRTWQG